MSGTVWLTDLAFRMESIRMPVPLHDNLGEDYLENQGEVDRAYLDK